MSDKVKWAFLLNWDLSHPGGVNEVVKNLYDKFDASKAPSPLIVVNDWRYTHPVADEIEKQETVRLYIRSPLINNRKAYSLFRFMLELPWAIWRNVRMLRDLGIAAVNPHYPDLSALQWAVMNRLGLLKATLVLSLHGRDFREAATTSGLEARLWRFLFNSADAIVACAEGLRDEVRCKWPNLADRVHCIHNGIDVEKLQDSVKVALSKFADRKLGRYIVNVGTFEHKKGQDVLIKAFASLPHEVRGSLRLVMVGRTSDKVAELERLAESLNISGQVVLLRDLPQEEVLRIVYEAEIFVLSSRNEAFSIALLEAAALKKPLIATDVCGVRELIPDDTYGLIIPSEDVAALAEAIAGSLENGEQAVQRAEMLYSRVCAQFTWTQAAREYCASLPRG